LPVDASLIDNRKMREVLRETTKVAHALLPLEVDIVFFLQNGWLVPVASDGLGATGPLVRIRRSSVEALERAAGLILPIQRAVPALPELVAVLDGTGVGDGFVAPLLADDKLAGVWVLAAESGRTIDDKERLVCRALAGRMSLAIEKELCSAEVVRHASEAAAINEISMEMTQWLDLDRVLSVIIEKTQSLVGADVTGIALADEDARVIRMMPSRGRVEWDHRRLVHPYGYGVGGWVAANRVPLLVNNIYKEVEHFSPLLLEVLASEGLVSAICVPMFTRRGLVGVLSASSRREAAFSPSQLTLLQTLGNHAAIAIENARLYAELKASSEKLRNSISVHERLLSLVLENQGIQVIADTLSELVQCPIVVKDDHFQVLCWSCKGCASDRGPVQSPECAAEERQQVVESTEWLGTLCETKHSMRVSPPPGATDRTSRVITRIVRGSTLLGYISALEVEQPLNEQQQASVEEASIIFALEFLKQDIARASMLEHVIAAQEDERQRIARELHDETSQAITALMVGLDTTSLDITSNPAKAAERLSATKAIADGMLENVHRLISDLRPSLLDDLGLLSAIAWYGEQRLKPCGIAFDVQSVGLEKRLPPSIDTQLYRIVQEAITNIIRHAQASAVTVRLALRDGWLTLEIQDDGQGFDSQILQSTEVPLRNVGLWGMRERVGILKGEFRVQAAPGTGTTLTIQVPVSEAETAHG